MTKTLRAGWRLLAILTFSLSAAWSQERRPPNIVIITADNLGYSDLGCYGNRSIKTPRLDHLASQGARLTDFYTAGATCTVSRATLLTGRYPQRIRLNHQLSVEENRQGEGLRQSERLLPAYLKPLGYATGCFGKWNIGFAPGSRPTERGFDEFLGHRSGNMDYYTHVYAGEHDLYRGTEPVRMDGQYSTDLFADAACSFMERHADRPFLVYLPFNAPHYPAARNKAPGVPVVWQATPEAFAAYDSTPDEQDEKVRYAAVVTAVDMAVGRVLDRIAALGLEDDTIVIFYSDNGAFMAPGRGLEVASNKPLRDGGNTLWEGGIRVAALARWPGLVPAGAVVREPLISLDILPSLVLAAGGELPDYPQLDGKDMRAALAGKEPSPHQALFFHYRGYSAVRSGNHKLIREPGGGFQLYDLSQDAGESRNLATELPDVAARLRGKFDSWLGQFESPL